MRTPAPAAGQVWENVADPGLRQVLVLHVDGDPADPVLSTLARVTVRGLRRTTIRGDEFLRRFVLVPDATEPARP